MNKEHFINLLEQKRSEWVEEKERIFKLPKHDSQVDCLNWICIGAIDALNEIILELEPDRYE